MFDLLTSLLARARSLFYDNSGSGLAADNVQDAIDEIASSGAGQPFTTLTDPALNSIDATMIDTKGGVVITTTAAANDQTLPTPTDTSIAHQFTVINNDTSTDNIDIIGAIATTLQPGEKSLWVWDSTAWITAEANGLWFDDGTDLKAQNSTRNIDAQSGDLKGANALLSEGAIFNNGAGDNDFTIKKQTSGDAVKYDAGESTFKLFTFAQFQDPGTSVNSYKLGWIADSAGTPQYSSIQGIYGATPSMRLSVPHETGGAETAIVDISRIKIAMVTDDAVDLGATGSGRLKDIYISGALKAEGSGDSIILGTETNAATPRVSMKTRNSGYAAPSSANADSNGDKYVFWNSAAFKGGMGMDANEMWFQAMGSAGSDRFRFYVGDATTPSEIFRLGESEIITNESRVDRDVKIAKVTSGYAYIYDFGAETHTYLGKIILDTNTEISESSGDTLTENTSATNDIIYKLGDNAGVTKTKVQDSDGNDVMTVDSDGDIENSFGEDSVVDVTNLSDVSRAKLNSNGDGYHMDNFGFGTTTPTAKVDIKGDFVLRPSAVQTMVAATGITAAMILANQTVRVGGNGGDISITATPSIAAGEDGQILTIEGDDNTDTVTLRSENNLAGTDLNLDGGADFTLGRGDRITLVYNATYSKWFEDRRSNNTYTA